MLIRLYAINYSANYRLVKDFGTQFFSTSAAYAQALITALGKSK